MVKTGISIDGKKFKDEIDYRCAKTGLRRKDFSKLLGFCEPAIDKMIERERIGTRSFERLRKLNIEPLDYQVKSKSNKQMTIEEAEVIKKTWNRNERAEKASPHIDEEASQLLYEYVDLTEKTQKEIVSKLIKTYLPDMIQTWKKNIKYANKSTSELIDMNIKKDEKIEELEKALKDKNGGAE